MAAETGETHHASVSIWVVITDACNFCANIAFGILFTDEEPYLSLLAERKSWICLQGKSQGQSLGALY